MDGGFGADNRCEKLHQCSSAGPDPLFTAVSNFINNNVVTPIVNNVVKPFVNNVVIPLVNNVVIPYAKANYNALVASYNTLSNVGSQMWTGYQSLTKTIHDEQQSFYHSFNQEWQGSGSGSSSQGSGSGPSSHDQCIGLAQQFELAAGLTLALAGAIELILVASGAEEVFPPVALIPIALVVVAGALALVGAGIAFTCGPG
jgi:hypothetical protein